MREKDLKIVSQFLKDFQAETDRGAALVGAAMIESRLERILKSHFIDSCSFDDLFVSPNSPISTFSSKTKICHALGLITEKEKREINYIRKIRNEFAHSLENIKYSSKPISSYCLNLQADTPGDLKGKKEYRGLFVNSVILTSLALWYRSEYAKNLKSKQREWEHEL